MTPAVVSAVAVGAEQTWVDGRRYSSSFPEGPDGTRWSMPLAVLVERVARAADKAPAVALVILPDALALLGLGGTPGPEAEAEIEAVKAAGWRAGAPRHWTSLYWTGRPAVHMCVPGWASPEHPDGYLIDVDDPQGSTRRLALYARHAGGPFVVTPGVSALVALRERSYRGTPYWKPEMARMEAAIRLGEREQYWESDDPAAGYHPHRHRYDAYAAYLAAAALVPVAAGALERTGPTWDPKRSGWWLITAPPWNDKRLPSPLGDGQLADTKGRHWVTTPTLALLDELADAGECAAPALHDSWTAEGSRRVLRPWAEGLRDALAVLAEDPDDDAQAVRRALKETYRQGIGMFGYRPGSMYRPDWQQAVVAQARVSLWRRLWTIGKAEGRWPLTIDVDCIEYGSPLADPIEACPRGLTLGAGLGKFTVKAAERVSA